MVLLAAAALLAALAAGVLALSRQPGEGALRALGVGNGVSAVAVAVWAVLDGAFGSMMRTILLIVAAVLAAVAVAQIRVARG